MCNVPRYKYVLPLISLDSLLILRMRDIDLLQYFHADFTTVGLPTRGSFSRVSSLDRNFVNQNCALRSLTV